METAMKNMSEKADFHVKWMPYQLRPRAPKGVGVERPAGVGKELREMGKVEGIEFCGKGPTGNTFDSHRLISLAWREGGEKMQDALVEELFKNYFEQEKSMGDPDVLIAAGEKVGLKNVAEFLKGDGETEQVMEDMKFEPVPGLPVMGVPHYRVGPRFTFSGAQDVLTFEKMFERWIKVQAESKM